MIADTMIPVANHLWQSTLFVIVVWLITLTLGKNRAAVRHRLWLAASVKFLVPFSLLAALGGYLQPATPITTVPAVAMIAEVSEPFSASVVASTPQASVLAVVLTGVWLCGTVVSLFWWFVRWQRVRRAVRLASPSNLEGPLRVMHGPERFEPGVFGIFRPVLLLPVGMTDRLSPAQLQAVLAHEVCHVRRRDNLTMAIHLVVEALFWFHPLVWFIKARILEEQERACDEEVLALGNDPRVYAESILKICEFYLVSPLICVSGIAGSNLKKRIEVIMKNRVALHLNFSRTFLLAVAAIVALAVPIVMGMAQRGDGGAGAAQGYRIGEVKVVGATAIPSEMIRSSLGLASGDVFDESQIGKAFRALQNLYGAFGYAEFFPEPALDLDESRKVVNITVHLREGRQFTISSISFTGNTRTRDEVLQREIPVKEGAVFNSSLLEQSRSRLNQMGLFEEIKPEDIRVQPASSEPKLDIAFRVKEKGQ